MDCPTCGYVMTEFETDCPRCKRLGAGAAPGRAAPAAGSPAATLPRPAPLAPEFDQARERRDSAARRLRSVAEATVWGGVLIGGLSILGNLLAYFQGEITAYWLAGGFVGGFLIIGAGVFWSILLHAAAETLACLGRIEDLQP